MTTNAGLGGAQEPRMGGGGSDGRGGGLSLPEIAVACEAFLRVWRDPDAVSPTFGAPTKQLLTALGVGAGDGLSDALRVLFNGGPDTSIRTTWHDGEEYWEVPAVEMREVLALLDQPTPEPQP